MRLFIFYLCCLSIAFSEGYTLATAQKLFTEKKYADAYIIYSYIGMNREALRPYMQYAAAECLFQQKKYSEALELLRSVQPRGRQILQDQVRAMQYACTELLGNSDELTIEQRLWYGEYLFTKNRFAESIAWLTTTTNENTLTRNSYILGRDYFSLGAWTSANLELRKISTPEAQYYRALTLLQLGRAQEALVLLRFVAQGTSTYAPYALFQLARNAQYRGDTAQRNVYYRQILHRFPKHILADDVAWTLGWQLYRTKAYAQAQGVFMHGYMAQAQGDHSDALLFWAGKCAEKRKNNEEALVLWQKTALQFPGRYYGLRAAELVSVNVVTTGSVLSTKDCPASIQQFIQEQAYKEALLELEQISPNMLEADIIAAQRSIAYAAGDAGAYTESILALYPLFLRAEKNGYGFITAKDWYYYFPLAFKDTVATIQKKYTRVPEALVYAVMREESLFDPKVISAAGATGLMQLMPATAKLLAARRNDLWEPERLPSPEINIGFGVFYLNNLLIRYKDEIHVSLAGYNAGPVATDSWYKRWLDDRDEWIENLTYRETRGYVKKVWRSYIWYKKLYFSTSQP